MLERAFPGRNFGKSLHNMAFEITLAPGVETEVQEILEYLESVAGQASAKRFMLSFANKIDQISQFPRQFPESQRFDAARKCIVYGTFILYYRIKGNDKVEVVTIRHAKSSRV